MWTTTQSSVIAKLLVRVLFDCSRIAVALTWMFVCVVSGTS